MLDKIKKTDSIIKLYFNISIIEICINILYIISKLYQKIWKAENYKSPPLSTMVSSLAFHISLPLHPPSATNGYIHC